MRSTTNPVRRLIGALVVAAIPVTGLATPAHALPPPTISISDRTVTEGDSGTLNASFTISLSSPKVSATVQWATVAGSASAGADYVAASGQVSLSRNARNVQVVVKVNGDLLDEPNETFTVVLSNAVGAAIADGTGLGTINDNDATPSLSAADASAYESDGTVSITVALSAPSGRTVTVDYATSDGSALDGTDYAGTSGTLTFSPGQVSRGVSVDLLDDTIDEPDRAFVLDLSAPTNATLGDPQASVVVADDDATPAISVIDVTGGEADGTFTFDISLSNPSSSTISVDYATADGSALDTEDYTAATGTVTFPAGTTSATVDVAVTDDAVDEPTQAFTLGLTNPVNATIADGTGTGYILDDDGGPWVSVSNVSASETAGTITFTLVLDGASQQDVAVDYATMDGTALAGSDYTSTSGTATFLAGTTTFDVTVPLTDDTAFESNEAFTLALSNANGLSIADGSANAIITSNDKAPTSLTLRVVKRKTDVKAKGFITYALSGMKIRVTLFKRSGGAWVKMSAKTATVTSIRDRNGDGVLEGAYSTSFSRPKPGKYKIQALYAGNGTRKPCQAAKTFRL